MRPIVFFMLLAVISASALIAYDMNHGFIAGLLFCSAIVLLAGCEGLIKTKDYEPTFYNRK